jgi:phosphoglycerate dehydrogenase-like enzyme
MIAELHSIAWQSQNQPSTLVVAGASWLSHGLVAALPDAQLLGYVVESAEVVVAERGALAAVADEILEQAKIVLLVDPEDREHWRVESILAGRSAARVIALPSLSAVGAAEHAMLLTLVLSRQLLLAYVALAIGKETDPDYRKPSRAERNWMGLPESGVLAGQMLGVIGLGRSGAAFAERALGFGMRVIYHDIVEKPREEARLGVQRRRFDQLLRESDVVSLHLPFSAETHRLIDAPELAAMNPTALLINVADGRLVDEGSLIKALRGGDIAGAGLDAFAYEPLSPDSPLIGFDNVALTPGTAWISEPTEQAHWLSQMGHILSNIVW